MINSDNNLLFNSIPFLDLIEQEETTEQASNEPISLKITNDILFDEASQNVNKYAQNILFSQQDLQYEQLPVKSQQEIASKEEKFRQLEITHNSLSGMYQNLANDFKQLCVQVGVLTRENSQLERDLYLSKQSQIDIAERVEKKQLENHQQKELLINILTRLKTQNEKQKTQIEEQKREIERQKMQIVGQKIQIEGQKGQIENLKSDPVVVLQNSTRKRKMTLDQNPQYTKQQKKTPEIPIFYWKR